MEHSELAKLVDRSGFLFQLAVEEHVRSGSNSHGWEVLAREYPWSSPDGLRGGFIDFVADRFGLRAVFECKRTQDGEWIFLTRQDQAPTVKLRTLWSYLSESGARGYGWDDLHFEPASAFAEFCIVRGGSDDDKPMLERIAGDLVRATESLAREELETLGRRNGPTGYIPVIVTNATLRVCRVNLADVDLKRGVLPSSAEFEIVPAVRFRKATASDVKHEPNTYASIRDGLVKKERSAMVVNIEHLASWLGAVVERTSGIDAPPRPWHHLGR